MDAPDAAIRMTALQMATDVAASLPSNFENTEDFFKFVEKLYEWLKESGDAGEVVTLTRVQ